MSNSDLVEKPDTVHVYNDATKRGISPLADGGRPFKVGNPGRPAFWTREKVEPALIKAHGCITETARVLTATFGRPCRRDTVNRIVRENPDLKRSAQESWEATIEALHHATIEGAMRGDQRDRHLILTRWHSGYRAKQELMGEGGGALTLGPAKPKTPVDALLEGVNVEMLSDDEQVELALLCEKIEQGGGITALNVGDFTRTQTLVNKGKGIDVTPATPQIPILRYES